MPWTELVCTMIVRQEGSVSRNTAVVNVFLLLLKIVGKLKVDVEEMLCLVHCLWECNPKIIVILVLIALED